MLPTQALTTRFEIAGGVEGVPAEPARATSTMSSLIGGATRQGFRIGDLRMMISYEDASELSELPSIHRLSNAPDWFRGMANLQGKLTPVFDLARYIGVEADPKAKRMLLVLAHGRDAAGVLIDGLPERLRLADDDERADTNVAPKRLAPHLRGARYLGGRLWFDLDARSLLDAIEHALGAPQ
jgi:twitching motility protein PilI